MQVGTMWVAQFCVKRKSRQRCGWNAGMLECFARLCRRLRIQRECVSCFEQFVSVVRLVATFACRGVSVAGLCSVFLVSGRFHGLSIGHWPSGGPEVPTHPLKPQSHRACGAPGDPPFLEQPQRDLVEESRTAIDRSLHAACSMQAWRVCCASSWV